MIDLITVAGGLLGGLLLVGVVLHLTLGSEIEWDDTNGDNDDPVGEVSVDE